MKKILLLLISILCSQIVFGDESPKLRIKISGVNSNSYFLCVGNVGCVSIMAGDKGKFYPMSNGDIRYVYTTNISKMRLYPQALPESCNISVKDNQTVTIKGRLVYGPNQQVHINNLNCLVS